MKKILAIVGSPRKGQTYEAIQRFEAELNKLEAVQVEYIMLNKWDISDCTGCHNCIKKGESYCHESLKIRDIQDKMLHADGVILASPVYNQHVTALMKKFMDYFTFLWHRPALFGVKFLGISTGGGMFNPVFKYLKMNAENWGGTWAGGLGVPHYDALTPKYRAKLDADITKKAAEFIKSMEIKDLPRPSLGRLLWFNIWKMNAEACKKDVIKDYEHWMQTNWFNMDYYYNTKVGIFKKIALMLILKQAQGYMKKVYVDY